MDGNGNRANLTEITEQKVSGGNVTDALVQDGVSTDMENDGRQGNISQVSRSNPQAGTITPPREKDSLKKPEEVGNNSGTDRSQLTSSCGDDKDTQAEKRPMMGKVQEMPVKVEVGAKNIERESGQQLSLDVSTKKTLLKPLYIKTDFSKGFSAGRHVATDSKETQSVSTNIVELRGALSKSRNVLAKCLKKNSRWWVKLGLGIPAVGLMIFLGLAQGGNVYDSLHALLTGVPGNIVLGLAIAVCFGWFVIYIGGILNKIIDKSQKDQDIHIFGKSYKKSLAMINPFIDLLKKCSFSQASSTDQSKKREGLIIVDSYKSKEAGRCSPGPCLLGGGALRSLSPKKEQLQEKLSEMDGEKIVIDLIASQVMLLLQKKYPNESELKGRLQHAMNKIERGENKTLLVKLKDKLAAEGEPGSFISKVINRIEAREKELTNWSSITEKGEKKPIKDISLMSMEQLTVLDALYDQFIRIICATPEDLTKWQNENVEDSQKLTYEPGHKATGEARFKFLREFYEKLEKSAKIDLIQDYNEKYNVALTQDAFDEVKRLFGYNIKALDTATRWRFFAQSDGVRAFFKNFITLTVAKHERQSNKKRMDKQPWRCWLANGIANLNVIGNGVIILGSALLGISAFMPVTQGISIPFVICTLAFFSAGVLAALFTTRQAVIKSYKNFWWAIFYSRWKPYQFVGLLFAAVTTVGSVYIASHSAISLLPNLLNLIGVSCLVPSWINSMIAVIVCSLTAVCAFGLYGSFTVNYMSNKMTKHYPLEEDQKKQKNGSDAQSWFAKVASCAKIVMIYTLPFLAAVGQVLVVFNAIGVMNSGILGEALLATLLGCIFITLFCSFCRQWDGAYKVARRYFGIVDKSPNPEPANALMQDRKGVKVDNEINAKTKNNSNHRELSTILEVEEPSAVASLSVAVA